MGSAEGACPGRGEKASCVCRVWRRVGGWLASRGPGRAGGLGEPAGRGRQDVWWTGSVVLVWWPADVCS